MSQNDFTLEQAIDKIEKAGGIVLMDDPAFEANLEEEDKKIREEMLKEYNERKKQVFKEFDRLLGRKDFSASKVEDMIHENGLDMDDLEEMIHGMY